ncbi:MAG TPA: xylulokinase, partial [Armatimonadetes bacterium]|nr:xylulokinase [Armatimonadota bacterium]
MIKLCRRVNALSHRGHHTTCGITKCSNGLRRRIQMSRGSYILAYDLGTTGNKATLFDPDGQIVASAYHGYETTYPQPGWSEQHPEDWWESIVASTRELLQSSGIHPSDIIAIGLSGHMMGCLPVDGDGEPLRAALIHSDTRSMLQCERIQSLIGADRFFEITGQILDPHYTLPKILWLKDNEPHVYERTRFFLQCKDYVRFKLTDELGITDFSDASLSGAYDLHTCQWSDELLTALEVSPKLLPEVHPSSAVIGMVTKEAADATGLVAGTPVVAGAGDGSCATFGAGVTRAGQAYNYLGGTSWIAALTDGLVLDMQQRLFTMGHVEFARFAIIGTVQCAGSSYQWLADEICWFERESARERDASQFDLMNELARSAPVGSHKLFF